MAVVKADAYGHGAPAVANHLAGLGIRSFAVAHVYEATRLRDAGITGRILVLQPDYHVDRETYQRYGLECLINGPGDIEAWKDGPRVRAHLFVDTGMGREGVMAEGFQTCMDRMADHPVLELAGLGTHFATADEEDLGFARKQLSVFKELVDRIPAALRAKIKVHAANSGGIINLPDSHFDIVRPGIWMYGQYTGSGTFYQKVAMSAHGRLTAVKQVPAGYAVGYGCTYRTQNPTRLGIVSAGYADGYPRLKSGNARAWIRGRPYTVAGRVSMDAVILDLGPDSEARDGDEVLLFGGEADAPSSITRDAVSLKTITYERCCQLGMRLPRIYLNKK